MDQINTDQLGELIDRHAAALELFARQWTDSAADVVQMAFVRLAANPPAADRILGWLYRVVRNGAISAARSDARRRRHEIGSAQSRSNWFVASPDDRLDGMEASIGLMELPQIEREVIIARLWGGLSFMEIAEVLEISSSAAHRSYVAGLTTLREKLGVTWLKNLS